MESRPEGGGDGSVQPSSPGDVKLGSNELGLEGMLSGGIVTLEGEVAGGLERVSVQSLSSGFSDLEGMLDGGKELSALTCSGEKDGRLDVEAEGEAGGKLEAAAEGGTEVPATVVESSQLSSSGPEAVFSRTEVAMELAGAVETRLGMELGGDDGPGEAIVEGEGTAVSSQSSVAAANAPKRVRASKRDDFITDSERLASTKEAWSLYLR